MNISSFHRDEVYKLKSHAGYSEARNDAQYKECRYTTRRQHQRRDVLMLSYKHIWTCIYQGCTYLPRTLLLRQFY